MKINVWMFCLTACLAVAVTAEAQQPGGRGGRGGGMFGGNIFSVAANEAAQKELGLTTDEVAKVKAVTDEYNAAAREARTSAGGGGGQGGGQNLSQEERAKFREKMAEINKTNTEKFLPKLKTALTADQFTRLQQLNWQNQGTGALSDPEIVKALTVTKDQQDKIKAISDESFAKMRELFTGGGGAGNREKMQELNKERDAKINEVLTKDQVDKFASLKGKEFDVSQLRGGFGGGGGGNGGGGNGGGGRPKRPQPKAE